MNDPGEATVVCPYNKAHVLLKSRMQFHLVKCRANHPNVEKAICPFNSTHVINLVEFDEHKENCPDRGVLDNFVYRMSNSTAPTSVLPVQTFSVTNDDDESWDDPPEPRPSVLEQVAQEAQDRAVLIPLIGASKSQRKAYRNEERIRHSQLKELQPRNAGPSSSSANSADEPAAETDAGFDNAPQTSEPKNTKVAPPPRFEEPKFIGSDSSASRNVPTNPWGGKTSAPLVASSFDFPSLGGSRGPRRDVEDGAVDQLSNLTLSDDSKTAWGKPAARNQDARISAPSRGLGSGGPRSQSNPWGVSRQTQNMTAPETSQMPPIGPDDFPVLGLGRGRKPNKN